MSKTIYTDFYQVLNIPENATESEIRKAYLEQNKLYHPDVLVNKTEEEQNIAKEKLFLAQEAYENLSNPDKRKVFDLERERRKQVEFMNQNEQQETRNFTEEKKQNKKEKSFSDKSFEDDIEKMKERIKNFEKKNFFSNAKEEKSDYLWEELIKEQKKQQKSTEKPKSSEENVQKENKEEKATIKGDSLEKQKSKAETKTGKSDSEPGKLDFSEIRSLEENQKQTEKELEYLKQQERKLTKEINLLRQRVHSSHQQEVQERTNRNPKYLEAQEYLNNFEKKRQKFITRLFISKKDIAKVHQMEKDMRDITEKTYNEVSHDLKQQLEEASKKFKDLQEKIDIKRNEQKKSQDKYTRHPLYFKYEHFKTMSNLMQENSFTQTPVEENHKKIA